MSQPVAGNPWVNVGTVGSVVVADRSTVLRKVILPGSFVGTVQWFDSATVAGTSATNLIHTQGIPLLRQWDSYEINANCSNGLVYAATGTPTLTFTWD
jgi:hypothetical protein